MDKSTVIENYLNRVEKEICKLTPSQSFIASLRNDLYDFWEASGECTLEDLENEFGLPEDVARDFIAEQNIMTPKFIKKKQRGRNIIIVILAAVLIAAAIFTIYSSFSTQVLEPEKTIIIYK